MARNIISLSVEPSDMATIAEVKKSGLSLASFVRFWLNFDRNCRNNGGQSGIETVNSLSQYRKKYADLLTVIARLYPDLYSKIGQIESIKEKLEARKPLTGGDATP